MIRVARNAGFCMGVKRALDLVRRLAAEGRGPIYTDGPLIHNPGIVETLARERIRALKDGESPGSGLIVIRAHGVSPRRREELKRIGLPLFDATCPDVAKVQAIVRRYARDGYEIAIVGDRGHAEVEGLLGFSEGGGRVVGSQRDVDTLPPGARVCVVAQTTQDAQLFRELAERIRLCAAECVVCDTICRSTKERQAEALDIARQADAVIVVGGKNSANTARLATIVGAAGVKVIHAESEKDLCARDFAEAQRIGIVAGASTPHWSIERVEKWLRLHRFASAPPAAPGCSGPSCASEKPDNPHPGKNLC